MIYFIILLTLYFCFIMVHAIIQLKHDKKIETIAYRFWTDSLHKTGYPKKENGSWLTMWESYDYWNTKVDKKPWIKHAKSN